MKKLMIAIFMFVVCSNGFEKNNSFSLLDYFAGEYSAYSEVKIENKSKTDLGFCFMYNEPVDQGLVGESVKIEDFEVASAIKTLNAKVVKTECLDNGTVVIYAYTNKINKTVEINNKKVNLQIAHNDEYAIIGWPLILGSF